jgi:uracil phosphoribosyltransferase
MREFVAARSHPPPSLSPPLTGPAPSPPPRSPLFRQLFYVKLPSDIARFRVLLVDPMLATGQSAALALRELKKRGVPEESIIFVNVVACPEGIEALTREFPGVSIITAGVDVGLTPERYITPGLGDFGDRVFGTTDRPRRR